MKKHHYEKNIASLLIVFGPVLALLLIVLHNSFTSTKERIDCQGSLLKDRHNLAIIILGGGVLNP
ncbi:hypothetical protein D3H65_20525 [Paraflavitalea soli]|uniref:Uncharacterized protein n=1 Tax=Paraflavitalea soli TaxID=2315862 RepID=A0A3B7MSG4_9BACT|nr:hypothetical protein D3H65_20525 [Paraflavitalea soli]